MQPDDLKEPAPQEARRAAVNDLHSLLARRQDISDAAFSEQLWNTAIRLYLQAHAERPALN